MFKISLVALIFSSSILFSGNAIAQYVATDSAMKARMYHDISILASDSLQGREAGTAGERMASDYISKQMHDIGLLPKGDHDSSYISEFRINYPVIFKGAKLRVNNVDFKYTEEFGVTDLSAPGNVTAPLIDLGIGTDGSDSDSDNGAHIRDITGKIAILDIDGSAKDDNTELLEDITNRVKSVVDKGAVGIILHNTQHKSTEDVLFGSPFTESLNVPVVYVARLPFNKIKSIDSKIASISVEIDRTVSKPANVIGWIDNKSTKTVVVGAHYDHLGIVKARGSADKTPQIHNGADDNASGTAALLELARWVVTDKNLKYNYIFAAFSAEEKGLYGSKAFCSRAWVNNSNIIYMLNMDMVGRLGCQGDTIRALGIASSTIWEGLIDTISHPDFAILKINGAPNFSDHAPFIRKEIPAIFFTTGLHPQYHTPQDDIQLINFTGMAEIESYLQHFIKSTEALPEIPFHRINTLQNTRAIIQTFK